MTRLTPLIIYTALSAALLLAACSGAKISVADEQLSRGEYFDAAKTYRKIYNKLSPRKQREQRADVAYKMAECHRLLGQDARAATAYQNALRYGYPDSSIILRLAQAQHGQGAYAKAIDSYEEYLRLFPGDNNASRQLSGARKAAELKKYSELGVTRFFRQSQDRAEEEEAILKQLEELDRGS